MNSTIALLTDFGTKDHFVGVLKAVIININPHAHTIDLCHEVSSFDILEGALLLERSYRYFPKKTIFLIVVDPGVGSARKAIILKTKDYIFVAPDNGILTLIAQENRQNHIFEITNPRYFLKTISSTFHGRDIFAPVVAHLSRGTALKNFGPRQKTLKTLNIPTPKIDKKTQQINGKIIYIDKFGNLVTNIRQNGLRGRKNLLIRIKDKAIHGLSHSYSNAPKGQLLAITNSMGYLEIALNHDSASHFLNAKKGGKVKLSFTT